MRSSLLCIAQQHGNGIAPLLCVSSARPPHTTDQLVYYASIICASRALNGNFPAAFFFVCFCRCRCPSPSRPSRSGHAREPRLCVRACFSCGLRALHRRGQWGQQFVSAFSVFVGRTASTRPIAGHYLLNVVKGWALGKLIPHRSRERNINGCNSCPIITCCVCAANRKCYDRLRPIRERL